MASAYAVRRARGAEYPALYAVMVAAVRSGPSPYTEAQRARWLPRAEPAPEWSARLAAQTVIVAEGDARIAGFMTLRHDGYIDLAHIRPEDRGRGLFRLLYAQIEAAALTAGLSRLWVHASLSAQAPFAAMGFEVVREELVTIGDQTLARAEMAKSLGLRP